MDRETKEIYQQFAAVKSAMLSVAMMSVGGIFIFSYFTVACLLEGKGRLAITACALFAGFLLVMKKSIEMYRLNKKIMQCILDEDYTAANAIIAGINQKDSD